MLCAVNVHVGLTAPPLGPCGPGRRYPCGMRAYPPVGGVRLKRMCRICTAVRCGGVEQARGGGRARARGEAQGRLAVSKRMRRDALSAMPLSLLP